MAYIGIKQAIALIGESSKQECNEFTLLHYINDSSEKIDVFIDNKIHGFHICRVGQYGYEVDDDWVAYSIDIDCKEKLKLSNDENGSITKIIALNEPANVVEVFKIDSIFSYVLLASKLDANTNDDIKELTFNSVKLLDLPYINQELGIGQLISKNDLLFDEKQIEKIGLKPIIREFSNTDKNNLRKELNKKTGISMCERIHATEPTLNNTQVAECVSAIFEDIGKKIDPSTILKWNWKNKKTRLIKK
ncbi:hypothetical protein ACT4XO_09965 [Acinetobacter baumannii]